MSKTREPKSAHQIVSLTLSAVGALCLVASSVVGRLERDKVSTAAYLEDVTSSERPERDVEAPAAAAAGDPTPPVDPQE